MVFKVADAHCDYLYGAMEYGYSINDNSNSSNVITYNNLVSGNVNLQFFAVWVDYGIKIPFYLQAERMIDLYHSLLNQNSEHFVQFKSANFQSDKINTVLSIEGAEAIEGSLSVLNNYKRMGVSSMSLTWNENNEFAGAAEGHGNKGLTSFGKEVVRHMNEINVAVDIAHLSDRSIEDVLKLSNRPVYASHSNCRAIFNTKRSLPDEYIKEIALKGGLVCINFYPKQLLKKYMEASIEDIAAHIIHVVKIAGIKACGIGSDFDGMPQYPKDMNSPKCYSKLVSVLKREGLSDSDIEKILFDNLFRYISQYN